MLSFCGMIVPKYCLKSSSCSRSAGVGVEEDHALLLEVLLQLVVDDLRLVLRADAGEVLLLGLGDPQLVPGVLDVGGEVLPRVRLILGRLDVVEDVVEVDLAEIAAPLGHRAGIEIVEALVPELAHPVRLVLVRRDRVHELVRDAAPRLEEVVLGDGEAVLDRVVGADPLDDLDLGLRHYASLPTVAGRNGSYPSASSCFASSGPPDSTIRPSTNTWT